MFTRLGALLNLAQPLPKFQPGFGPEFWPDSILGKNVQFGVVFGNFSNFGIGWIFILCDQKTTPG